MNDYAFDAAGNTTNDAQLRKFTYDAENKQVEVKNSSDVTIGKYWYDGDGRRVKKRGWINGQWEETIFVYDASSRLVAEYLTILNQTPQVAYLTNDHLGSPRINTDEYGKVIARHDYRPYGEEVTERTHSQYVGDTIRKQFTGYERDGETDLDFAQARYYLKLHGRFTSVDPSRLSIDPQNPQTWRRYDFNLNNPLKYVDKNGKWPKPTHDKIIRKAFDLIDDKTIKRIQQGSAKVDQDGLNPKTLWEANAPQHAMTPAALVRKLGSVEAAKASARRMAVSFVDTEVSKAKAGFDEARNTSNETKKQELTLAALEAFGGAMHPVMDNRSPAHSDFQVYDFEEISVLTIGAHAGREHREPTDEEMNLMVDEMRARYRETFGDEAYNQAVSEEQRKLTEKRIAERGLPGALR